MSMGRTIVIVTTAAFITGCFAAYSIAPDLLHVAYLIIALATTAALLRHNKKALLLCVCGIALALGMMRVLLPAKNQAAPLTEQYKKQVRVEGVIQSDIEDKNNWSRYVMEIKTINGVSSKNKASVLVYEPYPTRCVSGEAVSFSAKLNEPKDFITATGRVFASKRYLRHAGIYAIAYLEESECTGKRKEPAIFERARKRIVTAMHTFLPVREAALLGGLVLGLRGAMSDELMEAFRITGLIHIIVLSGHNVTLVAESVRRLLKKAPTGIGLCIPLLVIVLFVLLAGAQTAAVRAGSMAIIALLARVSHREYDGIRALLVVAAAMTLYNPDQVVLSTSFHLSFLATLGMLLLAEPIERKITFVPEKYEIRGIVAATVATQLVLLPYLAYAIGEVSVISIPVNILILPIIPIAMACGAVVSGIALILPQLATVLSPIAYLPLRAITATAETMAHIPYATLPLPEVSVLWVLAATALLIGVGYRMTKKRNSKQ